MRQNAPLDLGLKILPTGLGFKVRQNAPFYTTISNTKSISSWKYKGLSDELIKSPTINNNSLAPKLEYIYKNMFVKFNGSCLIKQNKFTFNKKILNIYIDYDLDSSLNNCDPISENCLFGAIKITKNSDIDK